MKPASGSIGAHGMTICNHLLKTRARLRAATSTSDNVLMIGHAERRGGRPVTIVYNTLSHGGLGEISGALFLSIAVLRE